MKTMNPIMPGDVKLLPPDHPDYAHTTKILLRSILVSQGFGRLDHEIWQDGYEIEVLKRGEE